MKLFGYFAFVALFESRLNNQKEMNKYTRSTKHN